MPGMEEIRRNAMALTTRLERAAMDAADEIAHLLESWAKTNAPFHDITGNLRQSIKGQPEKVSANIYHVILSAGMSYGKFVELLHEGRYAFLWPAVVANEGRIKDIWARRLASALNPGGSLSSGGFRYINVTESERATGHIRRIRERG